MYRVQLLEEVTVALGEMSSALLAQFAELRVALEVSPSTVGRPYSALSPTGLRIAFLGDDRRAFVVFGVIERDRLVTVVELTFLGAP